jgi:hypothetical protein
MNAKKPKPYQFTKIFLKKFPEHTGIEITEDVLAEIKASINATEPHRKIDNKGRDTEYFTFRLQGVLVTIVCDTNTHKILTGIIETHNRAKFRKK